MYVGDSSQTEISFWFKDNGHVYKRVIGLI